MEHQDFSESEKELRELIVELGKRLYDRGFVAANDGNISVRLDKNWILATPTGKSKGYMKPEEMVLAHLYSNEYKGIVKPSTEIKMHKAIYHVREDVNAVVHTHPPIATAFAVAGIPLDQSLLAEVIVSLGTIPIAEYHTPSTPEFAQHVASYAKQHDAVLLANHGAVTLGRDLLQAYYRMETLEHYANISFIVHQLGQANTLSFDQVRELINMRSFYGVSSAPSPCEDCPLYNGDSQIAPTPEQTGSNEEQAPLSKPFEDVLTQKASVISKAELEQIIKKVVAKINNEYMK